MEGLGENMTSDRLKIFVYLGEVFPKDCHIYNLSSGFICWLWSISRGSEEGGEQGNVSVWVCPAILSKISNEDKSTNTRQQLSLI